MKKADIIALFNSLRPELQAAAEKYEAITGVKPCINSSEFRHLDWSYVKNWGKEELERILANRQNLIKRLNTEGEIYVHKQEMLASEEGKAFIQGLEDKKAEYIEEIKNTTESCRKSFNSLLETIGLDWEVKRLSHLDPRYISFDMEKKCDEQWPAELRVSIESDHRTRESSGLAMRVSSSLCGSGYLGENSKELEQFTAYVTIHKHASMFNGWVNTIYKDLAHKVWELNITIDKVDDQLEDPYTAWMESK